MVERTSSLLIGQNRIINQLCTNHKQLAAQNTYIQSNYLYYKIAPLLANKQLWGMNDFPILIDDWLNCSEFLLVTFGELHSTALAIQDVISQKESTYTTDGWDNVCSTSHTCKTLSEDGLSEES